MPSSSELDSRPSRRCSIRVLLATPGWPCGLLEIGSWAEHQGLAEVVIFQLQPGFLFHLDEEDRAFLISGEVDGEIVDSFARRGRALSFDSRITSLGLAAWHIRDSRHQWTYRLEAQPAGLEVTVLESLDSTPVWTAIQKRRRGGPGTGPTPDDSALNDALRAVGGQFLAKLVEFAPHVVGFRLEGGGIDLVKQYICATRLFSDAEIVLGGPTATSHPREVLDDTGADYVFAGEAEETFNQFLRLARLPDSRDHLPEIPGLAYRYTGRIYLNTLPRDGYDRNALDAGRPSGREPIARLRNRVCPAASAAVLAANRLDWSLLKGFRREFDSFYFTGGRGCPGACTFCAKLHGQEVRIKPAQQLLEEIEAADAHVAAGTIQVSRWCLFEHVDDPQLRSQKVAWAAVYDEDFFLHRKRAIEFFRLWDQSPLKNRYRLSLQTNPCSLLTSMGQVHEELLAWIDRVKPMVQLGAESFNPELLARWHKRHNLAQLNTVLDALDRTRQDYTVFQLLTDFDTTPEELVETLRLLIENAYHRRRMRIASSPYMIPLHASGIRPYLEYRAGYESRVRHFTDYEQPQPGWMDPLVAELADLADAELRWALHLPQRESALSQAFEAVLARIDEEVTQVRHARDGSPSRRARFDWLHEQAHWAMNRIRDVRFQGIG